MIQAIPMWGSLTSVWNMNSATLAEAGERLKF